VILLIGDLGSGKTTFVKGVAQGLSLKKNITSPTFVLMKVYKIKKLRSKIKELVHIDTYRGLSFSDLRGIGALERFLDKESVCLVEWGDALEKYLKEKNIFYKKIEFKNLDINKREITIKKYGSSTRGKGEKQEK